MNLADTFFGQRGEFRSSLENPKTSLADPAAWLLEWAGAKSSSGISVTNESALTYAAAYACIRVRAETIGSLSLGVFERFPDGSKRKATDHYLHPIIHDEPNPNMSSFTWKEVGQSHLDTDGNAYSLMERNGSGRVVAIWPAMPDMTELHLSDDATVSYEVEGIGKRIPQSDMLHIPGFGFDGYKGKSTIRCAAEAIGLGLAAQGGAAQYFADGSRPDGILSTDQDLDEQDRKDNVEAWYKSHKSKRAIAVLAGGLKYQPIVNTPEEAQFLESRQWQVNEVARFFRMQPHMIQDMSHATFSNIEHQSIDFVTHAIRPYVVRWEQELNRKLFLPSERGRFFVEFNLDVLLRGDTRSRYESYAKAIASGWINRNEVRVLERLNKAEGLDEFLTPMNMSSNDDNNSDDQAAA